MPAQVGREHVVAIGEPSGEMLEAPAVRGHAVQADERRSAAVAPLVHVQRHSDSSPFPDGR